MESFSNNNSASPPNDHLHSTVNLNEELGKLPSTWRDFLSSQFALRHRMCAPGTPSDFSSLPIPDRQYLLNLHSRAMKSLDFSAYSNDSNLISIWLDFIQLQRSLGADSTVVNRFYEKMREMKIGRRNARFYADWSKFGEECGNFTVANDIRTEGRLMVAASAAEVDLVSVSVSSVTIETVEKENMKPLQLVSKIPTIKSSRKLKRIGILSPPKRSDDTQFILDSPVPNPQDEVKPELLPRLLYKLPEIPPFGKSLNEQPPQETRAAVSLSITPEIKVTPPPSLLKSKKPASKQEQEKTPEIEVSRCIPEQAPKPRRQDPDASLVSSKRSSLSVNGKFYTKLEMIGKGGSSKVYKVLAADGKLYALKRVQLKGVDPTAAAGYINEMSLLKRLQLCDHIIKLIDAEVNRKDGIMYMVMECGEIDLAHLLQKQDKQSPNMNFVRVYWEQMLLAVHAIHDERVVHSDLKPANFLFVKGVLKLIDFGIAKTIQNDTTNIHRDHQVGTVNYMSPEAILDTNHGKAGAGGEKQEQCMKLGRSSDVWSLGIILYQMVHGKTPFSHLNMIQKLQCIINPKHPIELPPVSNPFLADVIRNCLKRDPKKRMTIPELLVHPFLRPDDLMSKFDAPIPGWTKPMVERLVKQILLRGQIQPGATPLEIVDDIYKQLSSAGDGTLDLTKRME